MERQQFEQLVKLLEGANETLHGIERELDEIRQTVDTIEKKGRQSP